MAPNEKSKFPLSFHAPTKQFYKKIKGRRVYFGANKAAALRKYKAEKDKWAAGFNPRCTTPIPNAVALRDVANHFLDAKRGRYCGW